MGRVETAVSFFYKNGRIVLIRPPRGDLQDDQCYVARRFADCWEERRKQYALMLLGPIKVENGQETRVCHSVCDHEVGQTKPEELSGSGLALSCPERGEERQDNGRKA